MTRLQSGMAKAECRHLYLDELVDEGIRFHCDNELVNDRMFVVSKKQERLMVCGDFEMLKVMVAHLVSNATKFSRDDSKVTISIKSDNNGTVRIEVIDEGIGIDPEEAEQLFAPFHQKDLTIRRRYEGAGLGLSLARLIARHHGGDIVVAPREDSLGSIFSVILPYQEK
jgi:signal transduction histidine kinase